MYVLNERSFFNRKNVGYFISLWIIHCHLMRTALKNLRFLSLCGNNVTHLPRTMGRLNPNCDVHLQRNPNLVYPPAPHATSVTSMRRYFHQERMALLRGTVLFVPHVKKSKFRANERLYRPGGSGYHVCKDRFEELVRTNSILM